MACFNSGRSNCHGPYYPCPVCCCACGCNSNSVVNPVVEGSFAFFNLLTTATVESGATIPVSLVLSGGTAISTTTLGEATLAPGTYQVAYNVTSAIGTNETNSFGLTLNGATIASSISTITGTVGDAESVSNTVILSVSSASVLRLANLGTETVSVTRANISIRKID